MRRRKPRRVGWLRDIGLSRMREARELRARAATMPRCTRGDRWNPTAHAIDGPHSCRLAWLDDAAECVYAARHFMRRAGSVLP